MIGLISPGFDFGGFNVRDFCLSYRYFGYRVLN